jgi:DNA-binding transcriptional ArsR family regulator
MNYQKYSFVVSAPNRKEIVKALDREKTPKELVKELKKQDANISRALRELVKEGVVICLTPKNKRGRIYTLSKVGFEIRKKITS